MIELQGVTKYYPTSLGKKYVFKDLNFCFPEKSNIGILGLNGSGKTTLLRMIGGIDFPNKGSIKVQGSISWPLGLVGGTQGSLSGRQNSQFITKEFAISGKCCLIFADFAGVLQPGCYKEKKGCYFLGLVVLCSNLVNQLFSAIRSKSLRTNT